MSDIDDDLQTRIDQASAEGDRVCAELKHQLDNARALVREAKVVLQDAEDRQAEGRSFAGHGRSGPDH